jgi:hypothetical protein
MPTPSPSLEREGDDVRSPPHSGHKHNKSIAPKPVMAAISVFATKADCQDTTQLRSKGAPLNSA